MFQKTLSLNDFYFGMDGFDYPMGNIQMIGKTLGGMYRAEKPLLTALMPDRALDEIARHAVDFWLTTEDLPDPENRVTVDGRGASHLAYKPNNQVPKRKLYDKLRAMLDELGLHPQHLIPRDLYMRNDIPIGRLRPSGRDLPFRQRPEDLGAGPRLQGARARQSLCRRHEFLRQHRRGESVAYRDRQCDARRRPPAAAARLSRLRTVPRAASKPTIGLIYFAAVVQGLALVTFPAASTIFTSPAGSVSPARATARCSFRRSSWPSSPRRLGRGWRVDSDYAACCWWDWPAIFLSMALLRQVRCCSARLWPSSCSCSPPARWGLASARP